MWLHGLRGKKILLTGASGFIGSHLLRRLRSTDSEIHATSRRHVGAKDGTHWWRGDLADFETARTIVSSIKPDFVFHLASHVSGARSLDNVIPTFRSNLMTTVNILSAATETGCTRVVLTSSLEECDGPQPIPSSPYAAAKWAGGGYARMFHALYQLPVVILRVFMVYGPAQQDLSKLVPYVTLSLLRGEAPRLASGQREVDWIYVDDVVDGILASSCAAAIDGCTIDIGSGQLVSIRGVVEQLVRTIKPSVEPLFGAIADRPLEQVRVANTANSFETLRWKPNTSLSEGLQNTVRWYREHGTSAL
jgi:nucleoside-diphosphate-sugar epimerase